MNEDSRPHASMVSLQRAAYMILPDARGEGGVTWRQAFHDDEEKIHMLELELEAEKAKLRAVVQKALGIARVVIGAPNMERKQLYAIGKQFFDWLVAGYSEYMKGGPDA